jgi:hypothetical protein
VTTAKQETTRRRRLAQLIAHSAAGTTIPPLTSPGRDGARRLLRE